MERMMDPQTNLFAWQAQGTQAAAGTPPAPGPGGQPAPSPSEPLFNLLTFVGVPFLLFWFLILRPMQRQERERKGKVAQLKKNDEVLLGSGILGKVISIKEKPGGLAGADDELVVQTEGGTRLRVIRSAVIRVAESGSEASAGNDSDKK